MIYRNENRAGYKKTKVGWIPQDWDCVKLGDHFTFKNGLNKEKSFFGHGTPIINYMDVLKNNALCNGDFMGLVTVTRNEMKNYEVKKGDVFFTRTSETIKDIGLTSVVLDDIQNTVFSGFILRARPISNVFSHEYKKYCFSTFEARKEIIKKSSYTTRALTNGRFLSEVLLPLPPIPEQEKIAVILGKWDEGIVKLEELIEAKRKLKKGLMQRLLTGKKRFKEFVVSAEMCKYHFFELPKDWGNVRVADIAKEIKKRHDGSNVIVLSCSKYDGLVNSLDYFGKKVYSDDTSNYKIVKCGQFAYPSNHVEEGSIGLLRHIEIGIVSPIYTVFQTNKKVEPEFIYALFKTELYRHIFSVNTNASVDRRGSLRWREFSNIHVPLPSLPEQQKIASALNTVDSEIELLNKKLESMKQQKKGLMQKLLTGKIRVKV